MRTRIDSVGAARQLETGIDLGRSPGFLAGAVSKRMTARLSAALAKYGLTTAQWAALSCLWREDGLTQTELSRRSGLDPVTLTEMLKRMETAGRVSRRRDDADRRFVRVYVADADESMRASIASSAAEINALATRGFSATERRQLIELLIRALENLTEGADR